MNLPHDAPLGRSRARVAFLVFSYAFFAAVAVFGLRFVGLFSYVPLLLLAVVGPLCLLGYNAFRGKINTRVVLLAALLGLSCGSSVFLFVEPVPWDRLVELGVYRPESSFPDGPVATRAVRDLEARIVRLDRATDSFRRFRAELRLVDGVPVSGASVLLRADPRAAYPAGTVLRWRGRIDLPFGWESVSYRTFLLAHAVIGESSARDAEVVGFERSFLPLLADRARAGLLASLGRLYPSDTRALLAGLLVGDDAFLPSDTRRAFADAGLSHLLAASGFNVAVVTAFLLALARPFGPSVRVSVGLAGMGAFALLAGAEPPVLRAVAMGGACLVVSEASLRRIRPFPVLVAVACLLLAFDPLALVGDAGFQLSFLAVFGLFVLSRPLGRALSFVPRWFFVRESLVLTLAASVACLPVLAVSFGRVSLFAPVANLLVAPLVAPATVFGFVSAFAEPWWPDGAYWIGFPVDALLRFMLWAWHAVAGLPFAAVATDFGPFAPAVFALASVLVFSLLGRGVLAEEKASGAEAGSREDLSN